ncbi:TPA: hypothetical protein ACX6Q6_003563 [Photobacterium damselae]
MLEVSQLESLLVDIQMESLKALLVRVKTGQATSQDFSVIRQWCKDNDININRTQETHPLMDLANSLADFDADREAYVN